MAVFTAIGAAIFGAGTFGALATAAALQVAAGIAVSLIGQSLAGNKSSSTGGIQGELQSSGDLPRSVIFGYTATAGSLVYANTWGTSGGTPNAYFTQVICLADYPIASLEQVWVNGELCSLGDTPHASYGYPVLEYRKGGKDYLWIKFYDGTQTVADSFLTATFSSTERPYTSSRVGKGCPYVVATSLIEESLYSNGFPSFKFAVNGAKLYDITKDTTAGGSGSHRWNNPATWGGDGDFLPAVQIYNIARGIYLNGDWLYGVQGPPGARLPAERWIEQVDKCRALIAGPDGNEATYRSGGEIQVSVAVNTTIEGLLTACQGRISEVGGTYTLNVGAPGDAVFTFTDGDIISTEEQSFTPFYGLSDTVNGISASYPSPAQGWNSKVAPPLLRSDLEQLDGNRRLMADVALNFVPYDGQVQRLMKSALEEARRARRHTFVLPPEAFVLEPNDVVEWTSTRNGYSSKMFRVDGVSDKANLDVMVDITEVDPADYDWNQETDYTAVPDGPVVRVRPAAQVMTGWSAIPAQMVDPDGNGWLPTIQVSYAGELHDIRAVRIQVREGWDDKRLIFDGEITYDITVVSPSVIINASFLQNRGYEARGIYLPFSGRETLWSNQDEDGTDSAWLAVTTPNVAPVPPGSINNTALNQYLKDAIDFVVGTGEGSARSLEERILDELDRVSGGVTENTMASDRDRKAISATVGAVQAAIVQEATTRATADTALSQSILDVAAQAASGLAEGLFTVRAESAPSGVLVRLALLGRITTLVDYVETGILIDLVSDGSGGFQSKILLKADSIYFTDGDVSTIPMVFEDGVLKLNVANIGTVTAGLLQNATGTSYFNLGTGAFRASAS